jgi:hypothetical protein
VRAPHRRPEDQPPVALETVRASEVNRCAGGPVQLSRGAGVVTVHMSEEDRCEDGSVGCKLGEDRVGAGPEAGIDKGELAVVRLDEVDIAATGTMKPPEPGCEQISQWDTLLGLSLA